jgi:hypothetical protein
MGNKPSNLTVLPGKKIQVKNQEVATVEDFQPMTNILPFGMCQSPSNPQVSAAQGAPQPCIPNVKVKWAPGGKDVSMTGPPALTADSKCNCLWGGLISIQDAAQPTVFIGNGVVMGSGGGGGGGKQQSRSQGPAGKGPGDSKAAGKTAPSAASSDKAEHTNEEEVNKFDLWIRLHIDPREASNRADIFVLSSSDGAIRQVRTIADDQIPGDDCVDLVFRSLILEKSYSLAVKKNGVDLPVFEDVSGQALHNMHGEGQDAASNEDPVWDEGFYTDADPGDE